MSLKEGDRREEKSFLSLKRRGSGEGAFFVVPKTVSPKAYSRNLIKRRLRHAFKDCQKASGKGGALCFYARKGIEDKSYQEIKEEIKKLLV